jgi:hypothetical protein
MTLNVLAACAAGAGCLVVLGVMHTSKVRLIRAKCAEIRKMEPLSQEEHEKILRQGFTPEKVPDNLDCVVIGSGIGMRALNS